MASSARVTDLAAERFDRLFAARETAQSRLADIDRRIAAECARYSDANGFNVRLSPEQVKRDLAAKAGRVS